MPLNRQKCPSPQPGFQLEELDGDFLIFHPGQRQIFHCNSTGALVWHLCNGQQSINDIIRLIQESYPESAQDIPDDVEDIIAQWIEQGAMTLA